MSKERVLLPPIPRLHSEIEGNLIRQWHCGARREVQGVGNYQSGSVKGLLLSDETGLTTLVCPTPHVPTATIDQILLCPKPTHILGPAESHLTDPKVKWLRPATQLVASKDLESFREAAVAARLSWTNAFVFREEQGGDGADAIASTGGLRTPQIGAIHAALAHWRAEEGAATIVMPTGTGKTEAMLALLVAERLPRVLVVVPTDALRRQLSEKFLSLGLLYQVGVLAASAQRPVVVTLLTQPVSVEEVDRLFTVTNVVVTTAALVAGCRQEIQERMAVHCSHLFIDEAHHVPAKTWYAFRQCFAAKKILQFTATPFRRDGKLVEGRQIYAYPLRKAQANGYFRHLRFMAIDVFPEAAGHAAIAEAAVTQLQLDLAAGFDHLILARVDSIARAKSLQRIYEAVSGGGCVVVHSGLTDRELLKRVTRLRSRAVRVAICVDMFGEGFDMPELKIAALHDVHKSLTTTLQFVGRFSRAAKNVGDATVVANVADARVEGALRDLYQEDADWNVLLPGMAERMTRRHRERQAFMSGFQEVPAEIPLHNVEPKMSAIVFRTECAEWEPELAAKMFPPHVPVVGPVINADRSVVLFVTREDSMVAWAHVASPQNTSWHLYLGFWDKDRQLLFVNSSNPDAATYALANYVSQDTARVLEGEDVFRVLAGFNRLTLMNLGLKHTLNRATRFTMYVGSDIEQGLSEAHQQNRIKTNLFGKGYEEGQRGTIGCSLKGKIWSYQVAEDVSEWIEWCRKIGTKLLNTAYTMDQLLATVILPTEVRERPSLFPIAIEWPDAFLLRRDLLVNIAIDGTSAPFFDVALELETPATTGPLRFSVIVHDKKTQYDIVFVDGSVAFQRANGGAALLKTDRRGDVPLEEVFILDPPIVRFADGTWLEGNRLFPPSVVQPYPRDRILSWDWTGVDLKQESQGSDKRPTSIQFRTIERLKAAVFGCAYDILMDDDGSNEIADIVGLREDGEGALVIHLFHCKYSKNSLPGARIDDLYVVCGQAQKCIGWCSDAERMLDMLIYRQQARFIRTGVSGFEVGNLNLLRRLRRRVHLLKPKVWVWIVQPGLSKKEATDNQLHLLAVTELYLKETCEVPFTAVASE